MEPESIEIIDVVEVESLPSDSHKNESIWLKSAEAQHRSRLGKSAFQQAISKLVNKYGAPLWQLRRGEARNTEYSVFAVDLIRLLNSGGDRKIREMLIANLTPDEGVSGALVIANKNIQVAQQRNLAADENFKSAKVNLGNAMANLRELGRSYGKKAVNEFKAGFGEEIDAGLKDLGIQAETVFDVEE